MDFALHDTHIILDYDEYWLEIEEYRRDKDQFLIAHICFEKFSPSILKRFIKEWTLFRTCVTAPLYALRDDGDEAKWLHFVSKFGFKPTGINVLCNSGDIRQLFISTVSHEHKQTDDQRHDNVEHRSIVCPTSHSAQPSIRGREQRL